MDDLLKDAIADAKAVRETALANAKIALEEAFTPRIQSMLSQKIQSEVEDEEEVPFEDPAIADEEEEVPFDEPAVAGEEEVAPEAEPEMAVEPEVGEEEVPFEDPAIADETEEVPFDEPAVEEPIEGVIEINGVKYAPVVSEEEEEPEADEMYEEEEPSEDELDLEAILRELDDEDDEVTEDYDENAVGDGLDSDEVETADEADLAENDVTSGIGASDNKVNDEANDSSKTGAQGPEGEGSDVEAGKEDDNNDVVDDLVEVNGVTYSKVQEEEGDDEEEDIDLEEILKALSEGDDEEEDAEAQAEAVSKLTSDLEEHRNVVKYLRSKLNEVNLLNAKLLFTNKLFRAHGLTNEQKLKVVETFDRAKNLREVKLVFSTLAESFGSKMTSTSKPIKESKGIASKAVASTKPKSTPKVIEDGFDMKQRFKKLANIL
jgi:hypothetical protein|tara:strand:- start:34 stop:1332 length:1299 start_codon:yes stop_codon:yes gene_type:complete